MQNRFSNLPLLTPFSDKNISAYLEVWAAIIKKMPDTPEKLELQNKITSLKEQWDSYTNDREFGDDSAFVGVGSRKSIVSKIKEFQQLTIINAYIHEFTSNNAEIMPLITQHNANEFERQEKAILDARQKAQERRAQAANSAPATPPPQTREEKMTALRTEIEEKIRALDLYFTSPDINEDIKKEIKEKIMYHQNLLSNASHSTDSQQALENILKRHAIWERDILPQMLRRYGRDAYPFPRLNSQQEISRADPDAYIKMWENIIQLMPEIEEKAALEGRVKDLRNFQGTELQAQIKQFENFILFKSYCTYWLPLMDADGKIFSLLNNSTQRAEAGTETFHPAKETPAPSTPKVKAAKKSDAPEKPKTEKIEDSDTLLPPGIQKQIKDITNYVNKLEEKIKAKKEGPEKKELTEQHTALIATIAYLRDKEKMSHADLTTILNENPSFDKPPNAFSRSTVDCFVKLACRSNGDPPPVLEKDQARQAAKQAAAAKDNDNASTEQNRSANQFNH